MSYDIKKEIYRDGVMYEEFGEIKKKAWDSMFPKSKATFEEKQKRKRYLKNHRLKGFEKKPNKKLQKHKRHISGKFWDRILNLPCVDVMKGSSTSKSVAPIIIGGGMEYMKHIVMMGDSLGKTKSVPLCVSVEMEPPNTPLLDLKDWNNYQMGPMDLVNLRPLIYK